jgi:hypothetical protein
LHVPFSVAEVKDAVFSCFPKGALGPDGLFYLFFHKFWDVVREDLMNIVMAFQVGSLDLFRLNFAMLTLVPKVDNAVDMKNFRPINLLNYSFKIFSKLLTIRLERVCQRLIASEQSAFISGRYILESVVMAHELVHSLHKTKEHGVILKLDLDFLLENLRLRGFSEKWIGWIKCISIGGSVSVVVNGEECNTFKYGKGLW